MRVRDLDKTQDEAMYLPGIAIDCLDSSIEGIDQAGNPNSSICFAIFDAGNAATIVGMHKRTLRKKRADRIMPAILLIEDGLGFYSV